MGKIAFVFAGQGAQYPGMGKEIYESSEAGKRVFDVVQNIRPGLKELCFSGSAEELSVTVNTQPALFAVDLACAAVMEELGVVPDGAAGFSLGEIPALAFAGAFSYEAGAELVMKRAVLMQESSEKNPGAMAAVLKLDDEAVEGLCREIGDIYPVNYNSPGQLVCAGKKEKIDILVNEAAAAGGRALPLAVSGAFHCPFMDAAADGMKKYLEDKELDAFRFPVYSNAAAKPYGGKELISKQINSPVRWKEIVSEMISGGFDTFVEVGAGKTLSGLIKKIDRSVRVMNVQTYDDALQAADLIKENANV
ncbi:MAG: ACP S-malonyltransferase [Clostridia bacterium]|nr:ACP S-malonyltransferase [Clostridia bacterium]